uniref:Uncharacterized protein n=1 Tax=Eutreptiella gymnastica TaxID=73025 RepID=A0A7S4FV15_9EUGL
MSHGEPIYFRDGHLQPILEPPSLLWPLGDNEGTTCGAILVQNAASRESLEVLGINPQSVVMPLMQLVPFRNAMQIIIGGFSCYYGALWQFQKIWRRYNVSRNLRHHHYRNNNQCCLDRDGPRHDLAHLFTIAATTRIQGQ